jgi:hypothetical protein
VETYRLFTADTYRLFGMKDTYRLLGTGVTYRQFGTGETYRLLGTEVIYKLFCAKNIFKLDEILVKMKQLFSIGYLALYIIQIIIYFTEEHMTE